METTERKMLKELKLLGYDYYDSNDIFKKTTLFPEEVETILRWLPDIYINHLGTGSLLTRSLISAKEPFDPTVLINLFEKSKLNESVKWTISHVLAIARTDNIADWLKGELLEKDSAFERAGLLDGLVTKADICDREQLMDILKKLFDKYCYFERYLKLYKKFGGKEDIPFLENKLKTPELTDFIKFVKRADEALNENKAMDARKRFDRDVSKVIDGILKRKREYKFPVG